MFLARSVKPLTLVAIALIMVGCVSTQTMETTNEHRAIEKDARILVIEPDVQLAFLKASGVAEVRADWTESGKQNVLAEIRKSLAGAGHELIDYEIMDTNPRDVQLIKLHEVVGSTILIHRFLNVPLPTKKNTFDWSLGPGVQEMATRADADYALFLFARGQYASSGRQALAYSLAVVGVGVSTGGQAAYVSLVDLRTGDVVWFNLAQTGAGTDMRKSEGAASLVRALLKDNPL